MKTGRVSQQSVPASDVISENDDNETEGGLDSGTGMSDKERRIRNKNAKKWRTFIDFLFRHVTVVNFKYNCFEREEMLSYMLALDKVEGLRTHMKLKKGEEPKISSLRMMSDATDLLVRNDYIMEANRIRKFLDIAGRMRGLGSVALGFYQVLKKGKVQGIDGLKDYVEHWKGMSLRSYDYTQLPFTSSGPVTLNVLERRFMSWPVALRTALNLAEKFLKLSCECTGLTLVTHDPAVLQKHMQAGEYILASRIERLLFDEGEPEVNNQAAMLLLSGGSKVTPKKDNWDLPPMEDIDPELLRPVLDDSLLLELPSEPPKEKKKGGKKGKSGSKSSSKGKKKKKK